MQEEYLNTGDEILYYRHNEINPDRLALIFIHGLGDSGLSFEYAFKYKKLRNFNIIIPDLIGYGRSSGAASQERYRFKAHIERLWFLIEHLKLERVVLLGHSMGGDITTLMCHENRNGVFEKYINIEGDVTQHDLFISSRAVKAHDEGNYDDWFYNHFMHRLIFEKLGHQMISRLYFASLNYCRLDAFLENSKELVERNTRLDGEFKSEIGEVYCKLGIPRVFCYGTLSCSNETLKYLKKNNMQVRAFEGAGHSPMVDSADEFYEFVTHYIE